MNFPLVDVTDERGPMEWASGTHMLSKAEGLRQVETGEAPLQRAYLNRGDVMIRDVRHIHRGTPNRFRYAETDGGDLATAAPLAVTAPRSISAFRAKCWKACRPAPRSRLRFNPVFDTVEEATQSAETYRLFAY